MAQHFLLSSRAKTLSLAHVLRMTDMEVETTFRELRWAETNGEPVCPKCGSLDAYDCRRPERGNSARFRCRNCKSDFTITGGTLFAWHKMPLRTYLFAIVIFCNEVKGKSMLALSRDLGTSYKAAFVLAHKLREAMAEELRGRTLGGPGVVAEIDGGHFGGSIRKSNYKKNRRDRRLAENQTGKRKVVVVIRERGGNTLPGVFRNEADALAFITQRVAKETVVHADEATAWHALHERFEMRRINHLECYSDGVACTNQAESFFARMRRAERGHHHHIAGPYLIRYAQEAAWREDARRVDNGAQVRRVALLGLNRKPSVDFCGYWQRHKS